MKWSLARLVNDRGGRGFVSWELYNEFKKAERGMLRLSPAGDACADSSLAATGYQPRSCTLHLVSRLAASNGRLLCVHK